MKNQKDDPTNFNLLRNRLSITMKKLIALHERIDETSSSRLKRAYTKLQNEVFNLYSVGIFDRGKSQFLNALLGEAILPSKMTPTSAVVTEIRYGDKPLAEVFWKDKTKQTILCTPEEARILLAIPADVEDKASYESPYSKAIIYLPLDFLKGGIVLTDTPGISDVGGRREETTIASLPDADGLVFITGPEAMGQEPEIRFLQKAKDSGYRDIFVVVNKFDTVDDDTDAAAVKANTRVFRDFLRDPEAPEDSIFFISARNALRKTGPTFQWEQFQKRLQNFLRRDRSRVKLSTPIWESRESIRNLRATISEKQALLQSNLSELEDAVHHVQSKVISLQKQRSNISDLVGMQMRSLRNSIKGQVANELRRINNKLRTEGTSVKLDSHYQIWKVWNRKGQVQTIQDEMSRRLSDFVANEYGDWARTVLTPELESGLNALKTSTEMIGDRFIKDLDAAKAKLLSINPKAAIASRTHTESGWDYVIAGGIGILLNPVAGVVGAMAGTKSMMASVAQSFVIAAVSIMAGITSPLMILALMGMGGILHMLTKTQTIDSSIKQSFLKTYCDNFEAKIDGEVDKMITELFEGGTAPDGTPIEGIDRINDGINHEMDSRIQQLEALANSALAKKKSGEAAVDAELRELDADSAVLDTLEQDMDKACEEYL